MLVTVVRFCYHSYDYRPNWIPLSPITITNCTESSLNNFAYEIFVLFAGLILLYLNFYQNGYNEYSQSLKKWAEEKKSDPGT